MRVTVEEMTLNEARPVAWWDLPNTIDPVAVAFTQLATPDTRKVSTYRITLAPGPDQAYGGGQVRSPAIPLCDVKLMERGTFPAQCHRDLGHSGMHRAFTVGGTGPGYWWDGDTATYTAEAAGADRG